MVRGASTAARYEGGGLPRVADDGDDLARGNVLVEEGSDDEASEMAGGSGDGNHGSSFVS